LRRKDAHRHQRSQAARRSCSSASAGWFAGCLAKEAGKRRFPRVAVKSVGGLFEFDGVEKTPDGTGNRVSGHDGRSIEGMDLLARDRPLRVTDEGRDRDLGESEVIGNACEAVKTRAPAN